MFVAQCSHVANAPLVGAFDPLNSPQSLITGSERHSRRKDLDLVAPANGSARQLHGLWLVLLEDQAEASAIQERCDFLLQVRT